MGSTRESAWSNAAAGFDAVDIYLGGNYEDRKFDSYGNSNATVAARFFSMYDPAGHEQPRVFLHWVLAGCAQPQTANLSTDKAVLERLGKLQNRDFGKVRVCIERVKELGEVIVIGFFRYDYGCHFEGVFVNSVYMEDGADLSKNALNTLGWKKVNTVQREKLAKLWVERGLLAFSTVLYTQQQDKDLNNSEFQPPQVVTKCNGETVVTLWTRVMRRKKTFHRLEFRFAEDGNLSNDLNLKRGKNEKQFCFNLERQHYLFCAFGKLHNAHLDKFYICAN